MKKTISLLAVMLLFGLIAPAFAQDQKEEQPIYNHNTIYAGSFTARQLYLRGENKTIWDSSNRPKSIKDLGCDKAYTSLRDSGIWIGNLSDSGQCLGSGEAPEWTSGNYLNFLSEINKMKSGRVDN